MKEFKDLIFSENTDEIEKLVKDGTLDVNGIVNYDERALSLATLCGSTDVMECLINLGADINLNDEGSLGYTPIEHAARENQIEALKLLIEKGADINKGNTIDSNALIGACIDANKEILEVLIDAGANVNHVDNEGQSALHYICRFAKQWGSGVITKTVNGVTTKLENPRFQEHTAVFNVLLEKAADVNLLTHYGYGPLHLAAKSDTPSFIKPLVEKGADVNLKNSKGFSPLHAACSAGCIEPSRQLLSHGADVNAVDNDGLTAIIFAVHVGNADLVALLLEHGAQTDIAAKASYGKIQAGDTPSAVAEKIKNPKIIALLK